MTTCEHEIYAAIEKGTLDARCAKCLKVCDLRDAKNLEAVRAEVEGLRFKCPHADPESE